MAKVLADEAYSDLAPIVAKLRAGVLNGVGHTPETMTPGGLTPRGGTGLIKWDALG
ncbi:MAG: hypothetical protein JO116_00740 [Planctomycetaceae bacterium]|nr:hypothetical protein [Planctomycetaceae bacterium]MBV8554056.1 hypothetical protein [Planctomycetaceae bacterium]MBV8611048.1 hypothetical protein [Singulisphaera sp.]